MYKFGTTTVINSNEDYTAKGMPLFSGQAATTSESGKEIPANFFVKRVNKFLKPNVKAIYVRRHNDPELAQVKINLSAVTDPGVYRIALYIRLQGSQNEYYANDYVFKGKPFFIEFEKTENAGTMTLAEKVVKIAKKYMQMVYEYPLIKVSNEGNTVVLDATDEYQRFTMVELQKYDDEAGMHQSCCSNVGEFVTIDTIDENSANNNGKITWGKNNGKDLKGKEGFGTYRQLIKDLRLPTAMNRRWGGIIEDETPIFGATYDQYTIYYCAKVGVQGLAYVGDTVETLTRHIFFVKTDLVNDWEAALANIGTPIEVEDGKYTPEPYEVEAQAAAEAASAQASTDSDQSGDIQTNATAIQANADAIAALADRVTALENNP